MQAGAANVLIPILRSWGLPPQGSRILTTHLVASDEHADRFCVIRQVSRSHCSAGRASREGHAVTFQEQGCSGCFDCEVYVLRDVAIRSGGLESIQLIGNDADKVSGVIEQRTAGVARLDRRGNLNVAAVVD